MSKSNYEIYCEKEQPKKLSQTPKQKTLQESLDYIQKCKNVYSPTIIEGMIYLLTQLYDISDTEVENILSGKTYWLV